MTIFVFWPVPSLPIEKDNICDIFYSMKVFFGTSPRVEERLRELTQELVHQIKKNGYTVLDEGTSVMPYEEFMKLMGRGKKGYHEYTQHKMKLIHAADICVFETSLHSSGIGFLVKESLQEGKPTIVLFFEKQMPYFIAGIDDDKLIIHSYNKNNLKKVIKETLDIAREHRDKRFNFFINPKLLEYLESTSKKEGVTKSKFIRNLILNHMKSLNP